MQTSDMQTSDLNVNKTESDHPTAIFRQFQEAIFSRERISVKTSTKTIFDLLQRQEIATLSLLIKAVIASFISTTFRGHFYLGANDIALTSTLEDLTKFANVKPSIFVPKSLFFMALRYKLSAIECHLSYCKLLQKRSNVWNSCLTWSPSRFLVTKRLKKSPQKLSPFL